MLNDRLPFEELIFKAFIALLLSYLRGFIRTLASLPNSAKTGRMMAVSKTTSALEKMQRTALVSEIAIDRRFCGDTALLERYPRLVLRRFFSVSRHSSEE